MKIVFELDSAKVMAIFKHAPTIFENSLENGLNAAAARMVQAARDNLRANDSLATSQLINSVRYESSGRFERIIEPKVNYAIYVEKGTRPGYKPPKLPLENWLKIRGAAQPERAVYALQNKIFKVGTKAHPFWEPAVKSTVPAMRAVVEQSLESAIKRSLG